MSRKQPPKKEVVDNRPTLIACGKHLINVTDVRMITQVRRNLYVVKMFSDPNPNFPCWVTGSQIQSLLKHFKIVVSDPDNPDDDPNNGEDDPIRWDRI